MILRARSGDRYRAIDLYSGIGGWSLGLRSAGIDVVASYDIWETANETNRLNSHHLIHTANIRELPLSDLPEDIDIVVGSPPCTEFSMANRGGSGDIDDGLIDIDRFLSIVDYLRPKYWAMENVPRVEHILKRELAAGGKLERFAHLNMSILTLDLSEFGLPQKRRRCIAGNIDEALLKTLAHRQGRLTLGNVIESLSKNPVRDPVFGLIIDRASLTEHNVWDWLSPEEARINQALKTLHPVYNGMAFPDVLDRPARTITATCTRVSRESIILADDVTPGRFRRLSVRERCSLQGFPVTFRLASNSNNQKMKMVGNAVPPVLSYLIAHTFLGTSPETLPLLSELGNELTPRRTEWLQSLEAEVAYVSELPTPGTYPLNRRFRFSIPTLHLKSGVRFELANDFIDVQRRWLVRFYFGTPKRILSIELNEGVKKLVEESVPEDLFSLLASFTAAAQEELSGFDSLAAQARWAHRCEEGPHPFDLLDYIDAQSAWFLETITRYLHCPEKIVDAVLDKQFGAIAKDLAGRTKLLRNAHVVVTGLFVGAVVNQILQDA